MGDSSPNQKRNQSPGGLQAGSRNKSTSRYARARAQVQSRGTFVEALINEWNMFWAGLKQDGIVVEDEFDQAEVSPLDLSKIKALTKSLSEERKKLNRHLENIHKELDLNSAKLESLKLVGGDFEDTVERISELNDLGQKISEQLNKVDSRLGDARKRQVLVDQK